MQFRIILFIFLMNISNKIFLGDSGIFLLSIILSSSLIYEHNIQKNIIFADEIFFLLLLPGFDLLRLTLKRLLSLKNPFEASEIHGVQVINDILDKKLPVSEGYKIFYNVNFPPHAAQNVCGVRYVKQGLRPNSFFSTKTHKSASGRDFLFVEGGDQHGVLSEDADAQVNMDGYISITPMKADLTDYDTLNYLNKVL